jgi:hypothetical protein
MTTPETRAFKKLYTIHVRNRYQIKRGEVWCKITYSTKDQPDQKETIKTRWTGCQWDSLKTYLDNLINL